jgi:hypothetical protein
MPNTLAHFGVQVLGTSAAFPTFDVRLLLLGPVLPDIPWILQRAAVGLLPGLDRIDLRLYVAIQASLLFCLILSAGIALATRQPLLVFCVLGVNCLAHLLLDAAEIKWANGVHLLVPFDWRMVNYGLFWPEHTVVLLLSLMGLAVAAAVILFRPGDPVGVAGGRSLGAAAALLFFYLAAPVLLMEQAERADVHYAHSFRSPAESVGKPIEFDRVRLEATASGSAIRTFAGTSLRVTGSLPAAEGTVSIRGRFTDIGTVAVGDAHLHVGALRELPTYVGLGLLVASLAAWLPATRRVAQRHIVQRPKIP